MGGGVGWAGPLPILLLIKCAEKSPLHQVLLLPGGIRLPGSLTPFNRFSQVQWIGLSEDRMVTEMPFIFQNLGS